jgi:uncharacterized protein (DUF362 family)
MIQQAAEQDNLPPGEKLSLMPRIDQKPDPQDNNTTKTKIIDALVEIVKTLTASTVVDIAKIIGTTIETIVKELSISGDKPAVIILAIAILIASLAVPIATVKSFPTQINQPVKNSSIKL